jgi:hypothetical protein
VWIASVGCSPSEVWRAGGKNVRAEGRHETYVVTFLPVDPIVNEGRLRGRVRVVEETEDVGQGVVVVRHSDVGGGRRRSQNAGWRCVGGSGGFVVSGHCRARRY